jgi:hypothetical protein
MKKLLLLILIGSMCLLMLLGCSTSSDETVETVTDETRFKVVYSDYPADNPSSDDMRTCILVDTETSVMYLYITGGQRAGLTIMEDANGNPLLWEGYSK